MLKTKIQELVQFSGKPKYLHTSEFVPGKSTVLYSGPYWDNREIEAAINALLTGKWLSAGEHVHKFEQEFAKKFNSKHALMVNSGSSANLIMIAALKRYYGWQDGDEIILSVVGFPTTLAPIIQNNLKPVFIDIELYSLNFDINKIKEKITNRTKAIFVSPVLGNPPNLMELFEELGEKEIAFILDGCDSLGTKHLFLDLNKFFDITSCSFYASHHLTTGGEGGMVYSDIEDMMKISRSLVNWSRDCYCQGVANLLPNGTCGNRFDTWLKPLYNDIVDHKYVFTEIGYNLKPLDLQGAIGLVQLDKFDEIKQKRIANKGTIAKLYLKYIPNITIPIDAPHARVSWFGVPIICETKELKRSLVSYLEANKIQTRNYFAGNILLHPGYSHLDDWQKYPLANEVLDRVFFVGCAPHYTEEVFKYVEEVLSKYDNK